MHTIYQIYNSLCISYENKHELLETLFSFFSKEYSYSNQINDLLYKSVSVRGKIDPLITFQLIGLIHQKKKESEKIVNTNRRKHFGIYYTDYKIARLITKESLSYTQDTNLLDLKFYEPCVGCGIFVISYIDEVLSRIPPTKKNVHRLINNIYFSDIDRDAIRILRKLLPLYIKFKYNVLIKIKPKNYFVGDILFGKVGENITKNNPKDIFKMKGGFDIVMSNPPYKLFKANSSKYHNGKENEHSDEIKKVVKFIRRNTTYKFIQGTLNYYKIFLEEIIENYSKPNGKVGVIVPATLLKDKHCELLRKRIIYTYQISNLYVGPEKNIFFPDISQAFCFFSLDKTKSGKSLKINPKVIDYEDFSNDSIEIKVEQLEKVSRNVPIVIENKIGWRILHKLSSQPKLSLFKSIANLRGELDLTSHKEFITLNPTNFHLLRGCNISEFFYTKGKHFVKNAFIKKIPIKSKFISSERIVCQQVSNMHGEKRLKFTKIPAGIVLGNSCNFLAINESIFNNNELSLDYLLGILNSLLLNWRFKTTSSNNHVSNYELADLPILIPTKTQRAKIEKLVRKIQYEKYSTTLMDLNNFIFDIYGLSNVEKKYILSKQSKNQTEENSEIS